MPGFSLRQFLNQNRFGPADVFAGCCRALVKVA